MKSINRRSFFKQSSLLSLSASFGVSANPEKEAQVLIIGSGPAGLSLADKLSASGVSVVVVESGVNRPTRQHQLLNEVTGDLKPIEAGLGVAGRRAFGGTTHIWGGITPRFTESDFKTNTNYGYGLDWPISFNEVSQYYCAAGAWLQNNDSLCIRGTESSLVDSSITLLNELKRNNIKHSLPASMSVNNKGEFNAINLEKSFGFSLRSKNITLFKNTTARRLDINKQGRVTGVYCSEFNGEEKYLNADVVVLAAGAIQNARLLLLSKSALHPDGIGNAEGNVGGYFMDHPNTQYWLEPKKALLSSKDDITYVHSYHYYDQMKKQGLGSALLRFGAFSARWKNNNKRRVFPESLGYATSKQSLMIEALCEQEPISSNRLTLSMEKKDQFGDPVAHLKFKQSLKDGNTIDYINNQLNGLAERFSVNHSIRPLRLSSHHLMGTTRMSDSDSTGVVDRNQKVFGTSNLYISGASVFSTGGAANPTLTLTALSLRLANHLVSINK